MTSLWSQNDRDSMPSLDKAKQENSENSDSEDEQIGFWRKFTFFTHGPTYLKKNRFVTQINIENIEEKIT